MKSAHTATAEAYAYGGAGGGGGGGVGGYSRANSKATGANAYATAKATGGASGGAGAGSGAAVAEAHAISTAATGNARAIATQTGGAGMEAETGAASSMLNQVGGSSDNGGLYLKQNANGGAGGAAGGAGGAAYSGLAFNDASSSTQSASVFAKVGAYGGYGGGAFAGGAGAGGHAKGVLYLKSAAPVGYVTAGGGSAGSGGTGAGGAAKAVADLVSTGGYANGGAFAAGGGGTAPGAAAAKDKVVSTSGTFDANATTGALGTADGLIVESVAAESAGPVDGESKAVARTEMSAIADAYSTTQTGVAFLTGLPSGSSTAPVFSGNAAIASAFGASPAVWAMGEFGGQRSGSVSGLQTIDDFLNVTLDASKLPASGNLEIGFFDPTVLGSGFKSLTLTISGNNGSADVTLFTQTFTTVASAESFFGDHAISLGALSSLPRAGGEVQLFIHVDIQTDAAGEGFYGQVILGDPPSATGHASRFAQHMAGLAASAGGSPGAVATAAATREPMLAIARMAAFA